MTQPISMPMISRHHRLSGGVGVALVWAWMVTGVMAAGSAPSGEFEGEVLVMFQPAAAPAAIEACRTGLGAEVVRDFPAVSRHRGQSIQHLRSAAGTAALVAGLSGNPAVAWVEPVRSRSLTAMPAPDDPQFVTQWALRNTGQFVNGVAGAAGADIRFLDAWGMAKPDAPQTVVALLDTGIDLSHLDLVPSLWTNPGEIPWDGLDNDANGRIDDVHGFNFIDNNGNPSDIDPAGSHGTHLAGVIAAAANNSQGVAGAAYRTKLMPLRITGTNGLVNTAAEVAAIDYLVLMKSRGVNVVAINASYADPGYSFIEETAVQAAAAAGIVFCAAAGNDGTDNTAVPVYPANLRLANMLVVAASDSYDNLAWFSNYGTKVDLAAPGELIYSTRTIWPTQPPVPALPIVTVDASLTRGATEFDATPVLFSGTTAGLTRSLHACGKGLTAADFPAAVSGNIALIQRGDVAYSVKLTNAMKAGAKGVVIYNHEVSSITPTLVSANAWIPAVFVSLADGQALLAGLPANVTLANVPSTTENAYKFAAGTSVATPFVTGAVAFAAAQFPNESAAQRVARVLNGTAPVGALAGRVLTGGRLDLTGIIDPGHNQIPDWWETDHFGVSGINAAADPDGDGFSNLQEYRIGTVPTNPASRLAVTETSVVTEGDGRHFRLTFPTAPDVIYRVECGTALAPGSWTPLGGEVTGTGTPATVTDPAPATLHPGRFYRVRILSP